MIMSTTYTGRIDLCPLYALIVAIPTGSNLHRLGRLSGITVSDAPVSNFARRWISLRLCPDGVISMVIIRRSLS